MKLQFLMKQKPPSRQQVRLQVHNRAFTLLEVMIALALIAMMAGVASWSLADLLSRHRFQSKVDELKDLLQELQIEALALQSDMELTLDKDNGIWKARSKTPEKILKNRCIELKGVNKITLDQAAEEKNLEFKIFSTGRIDPPRLVKIEGSNKEVWIDLRRPLQIKFSETHPGEFREVIPQKEK